VTAAYAEESTVARFTIGAQATVNDLKRRACSELAKTAQQNYGFANGFPSGDMASIVLSSGTIFIVFRISSLTYCLGSRGQLDFEPSTPVSSLCGSNEVIIATVPAPPKDSNVVAPNTISSILASPIHSRLHSLFQSHADTITADLLLRFDEVVKVEREKREEELKAALRAEREKREEERRAEKEKREEERRAEREKREEELKAALRAEREKREEELKAALKAEREEREEALNVEREKRESEKAEASKRYESLKNHLLDVEEMTLDTVGWITNNVSCRLARFIYQLNW
jgi:hypothetical protein